MANLDVAWGRDPTICREYQVLSTVDVGKSELMEPRNLSNVKRLNRWFLNFGEIKVTLSVPQIGYLTDEVVSADIQIENLSTKAVKSAELHLTQHITYRSKEKYDIELSFEFFRQTVVHFAGKQKANAI